MARFISGRYTASANLPSRMPIRDVVAAADEVTASNDQDAVVLVLERLAIHKLTAKPVSSPGNVPCASARE